MGNTILVHHKQLLEASAKKTISQFSVFSYKGRALSFPQVSLCHEIVRKRAGNVAKEKEQEGGVRLLSSVPHQPSGFLFLKSSARFTCLIILFSFLEYHGQPLRKRENQARTNFSTSEKKTTNAPRQGGISRGHDEH